MKVSVIIPCHNAEAYLADTICSVLSQTEPPEEIIVVDDRSTDGSQVVAQGFGPPVRLVSARNGNAPATRNQGAALARGDALMFLDADDLLGPTALESLVTALHRHPSAIALCPWFRRQRESGVWVNRPPSCEPRRPGQDPLDAWLTGWYHPPCSVLWSRAVYDRVGGWDPEIRVNNDGHIMLRALAMGVPLVTAEEGMAFYRRLPAGQTSLSALRFTPSGLRSRIRVVAETGSLLAARGDLRDHATALAAAYDLIAADCDGRFAEGRVECRRAARALGGPDWLRAARRLQHRAGRRLRRRLQHRTPEVIPARSAGHPAPSLLRATHGLPACASRDAPTVSVIVPTFNRARLLPRALASVTAQTFQDIEILVVDDGSTDDTASVVASLGDPRVRYLPQPCNRGPSAARNAGLREARGEFIAFLDSDDDWLPDKLALQIALFRRLPGTVGMVYSVCESGDPGVGSRRSIPPGVRGDVRRLLLESNVLHGAPSSAIIRREVIAAIGLFDEAMRAIEDWDYWLRMARLYEVDHVAVPLSRYHDPACSQVAGEAPRVSRNAAANLAARQHFYDKHREAMTDAGVEHRFLLDTARRHLQWNFATEEARRLILRAIACKPLDGSLYPWLLLMLLPWPARERLRRWRRHLLAASSRPARLGS